METACLLDLDTEMEIIIEAYLAWFFPGFYPLRRL